MFIFSYRRYLFLFLSLFLIIPVCSEAEIGVETEIETIQKKEAQELLPIPPVLKVFISTSVPLFSHHGEKQQSVAYVLLDDFKKYLSETKKVQFKYIFVLEEKLPAALREDQADIVIGPIQEIAHQAHLFHFFWPYLQHAWGPRGQFTQDHNELQKSPLSTFSKCGGNYMAAFESRLEPVLASKACLSRHTQVVWAIRRDLMQLKAAADRFFIIHSLSNYSVPPWPAAGPRHSYRSAKDNIESGMPIALNQKKLALFSPLFQFAASLYRIDWLLLLAIGMRETNLRHVVTKKGPTGVMQVTPSTAHSMGVKNPSHPQSNVTAAARYLHYLTGLFSDPAIDPEQRLLFVLAAYNAGEGKVKKLRSRAEKMGLDPNRWSGAVEKVAQQMVGIHLLRYVNWVSRFYQTIRTHYNPDRLSPSVSQSNTTKPGKIDIK